MTYHGIYHDDGIVSFKVNKSIQEIKYWLAEFQHILDKEAGNQKLQFTAEIWTKYTNLTPYQKKYRFQTVANEKYPFIYMKIIWSPEGT